MSAKKKKVYFFQGNFIEQGQDPTPVPQDFWARLHRRVTANPGRAEFLYHGLRYKGYAETDSGGQRYFYFSKVRPEADYPHTVSPGGATEPLTIRGDLLEYMYMRPYNMSSNMGLFLRSSNGPSWEAFEAWVVHVLGLVNDTKAFELAPVVRTNTLERLNGADGAARLDVKFERDQPLPDRGAVSNAAAAVREEVGRDLSVDIGLSVGQVRTGDGTPHELLEEAKAVAGGRGSKRFSKLQVKVVTREGDGTLRRELLDFVKDRISYRVPVGSSQNERPTHAVVLAALAEAAAKYRRNEPSS